MGKGITNEIDKIDGIGAHQVVGNLDASGMRFGIVVSRFNDQLTDELPGEFSQIHPFPGRDLSAALRGTEEPSKQPIYFMTEDEISRGDIHQGAISHEMFEAVGPPGCVESVVTEFDGNLWKLNRYYDADQRTDEEDWELHDLTSDPHERDNKYGDAIEARHALEGVLEQQRAAKRLTPNGVG